MVRIPLKKRLEQRSGFRYVALFVGHDALLKGKHGRFTVRSFKPWSRVREGGLNQRSRLWYFRRKNRLPSERCVRLGNDVLIGLADLDNQEKQQQWKNCADKGKNLHGMQDVSKSCAFAGRGGFFKDCANRWSDAGNVTLPCQKSQQRS